MRLQIGDLLREVGDFGFDADDLGDGIADRGIVGGDGIDEGLNSRLQRHDHSFEFMKFGDDRLPDLQDQALDLMFRRHAEHLGSPG
ncbi:hypothetical protein [Bradyrhizobium sp. I1.7.5]|uniref:hypothetical protein n=1 Tax=Bradyrhizobium sp. I1.7.5 TaxID=3156363 RepID=UPI003391937A